MLSALGVSYVFSVFAMRPFLRKPSSTKLTFKIRADCVQFVTLRNFHSNFQPTIFGHSKIQVLPWQKQWQLNILFSSSSNFLVTHFFPRRGYFEILHSVLGSNSNRFHTNCLPTLLAGIFWVTTQTI